jgi:hypothetical protein
LELCLLLQLQLLLVVLHVLLWMIWVQWASLQLPLHAWILIWWRRTWWCATQTWCTQLNVWGTYFVPSDKPYGNKSSHAMQHINAKSSRALSSQSNIPFLKYYNSTVKIWQTAQPWILNVHTVSYVRQMQICGGIQNFWDWCCHLLKE